MNTEHTSQVEYPPNTINEWLGCLTILWITIGLVGGVIVILMTIFTPTLLSKPLWGVGEGIFAVTRDFCDDVLLEGKRVRTGRIITSKDYIPNPLTPASNNRKLLDDLKMEVVIPDHGFAYFSGYIQGPLIKGTTVSSNPDIPVMYSSRQGVYVMGEGFREHYPLSEISKAIQSFKALAESR